MMQQISKEQKHFFETFGYLTFPNLFAHEIEQITSEFEAVFTDRNVLHDATRRSTVVPFIDQRAYLCQLLDDPRIEAIVSGLLGEDWNYLGGDGNFYTGNTGWHSDGVHSVNTYLKLAFYLDPLTRETGALRVIPGSHHLEWPWEARKAGQASTLWNIEQQDVPSVTLASQPGDLVVFNHNLMHASFGGNTRRRMFTLNVNGHCTTSEQLKDLEDYIAAGARFWVERTHSELMVQHATAQRMRHLRQVIEHEQHLPALAAQARASMSEPARG